MQASSNIEAAGVTPYEYYKNRQEMEEAEAEAEESPSTPEVTQSKRLSRGGVDSPRCVMLSVQYCSYYYLET